MKKTNHAILSVLLVAVLLFATLIIPAGAVDTYDINSGNTVNTVYRLGDADRDGNISVTDVTYILRWNVGISKDNVDADWLLYTGDVDGNRKVDVHDAGYIQQWLARLYVPYHVGEPIQNDTSTQERVWPLPGYYTLPYICSDDSQYITIDAPVGTPVLAAESGVVVAVHNTCPHLNALCTCGGGYGNHVWIRTNSGIEMIYGYLSATDVKVGDTVTVADTIGYVGSTGFARSPSLLFECRRDGVKIDPLSIYDIDSDEHVC